MFDLAPPPLAVPSRLKISSTLVGALLAAAYGISIRMRAWDGVMSTAFLVFVPLAMGWITVWFAQRGGVDGNPREATWFEATSLPALPIIIGDIAMLAGGIEGLICVVFAIPIMLGFACIGGYIAKLTFRMTHKGPTATACVALLPFLVWSIERFTTPPTRIETADTSIVIHADETTVWNNIKTVPAIRPDEIKPSWSHRIGFPLPIAATLDHEGVGGVRNASFQGNLVFIERVNEWQPNHQLGFTIKADTANIPPTTLDEHVTIGGRYFDVLDGQYRLEPIGNGNIRLHLVSHQRLSTDFNAYAALWTTSIMRDLQNSILQVIKHRCEHPAATT